MNPTLALVVFALLLVAAPAGVRMLGPLRRVPADAAAWDWRLTAASTLAYVLAFNVVFFIQELFLVLPKALTPGLTATLFHNNHDWEGDNPLAELFQGTGALAILLTGLFFVLWLRRARSGPTVRLLAIWMAFHGLVQALPQIAVGAAVAGNDTGRAMDFLGLGAAAKTVIALVALAAVPSAVLWLRRAFLAFSPVGADPRRFLWRAAALPALIGLPLIIPFRVPREAIEVLSGPILGTWIAIVWLQSAAWRPAHAVGGAMEGRPSIIPLAVAALLLLAFFQLVLRPGITFP